VARSRGAAARRLTVSVEIVRVRGPDGTHLAQVQLDAIKEVLAWALTQRSTDPHDTQQYDEDRAA
jgi:hypothetical protein